jgi:hypothetical protein
MAEAYILIQNGVFDSISRLLAARVVRLPRPILFLNESLISLYGSSLIFGSDNRVLSWDCVVFNNCSRGLLKGETVCCELMKISALGRLSR